MSTLMARLPIIDSDEHVWRVIPDDFLSAEPYAVRALFSTGTLAGYASVINGRISDTRVPSLWITDYRLDIYSSAGSLLVQSTDTASIWGTTGAQQANLSCPTARQAAGTAVGVALLSIGSPRSAV